MRARSRGAAAASAALTLTWTNATTAVWTLVAIVAVVVVAQEWSMRRRSAHPVSMDEVVAPSPSLSRRPTHHPTPEPTRHEPTPRPTPQPTPKPTYWYEGLAPPDAASTGELPIDARFRAQPPLRRAVLTPEQVLALPLCTDSRFVLTCYEYINFTKEFTDWRDRVHAERKRIRATQAWHAKCPSPTDAAPNVTISFRGWLPDWEKNRPELVRLDTCPVKTLVSFDPASTPAGHVLVDFHNPGAKPEHGELHAFLEMEDMRFEGDAGRVKFLARTDMLLSYTSLSDVWLTHNFELRSHPDELCWNQRNFAYASTFYDRCFPPVPTRTTLPEKQFAAVFISKCRDEEGARVRTRYVTALIDEMRRLARPGRRVMSFGRCFAGPEDSQSAGVGYTAESVKLKIEAIKKVKFVLAFENSWRHGYATEKQYHALLGGAVPVVWAAPDVEADFMPGRNFAVNAVDFATPEALARFLVGLDNDDDAYLSRFAWRSTPSLMNPLWPLLDAWDLTGGGSDSIACRLAVVYLREYCAPGSFPMPPSPSLPSPSSN